MGLGATTMLVAEWTALGQQDLRRMLAYSSLGQVGLIAMALAFGSEAVTAGALFHMVNHTLVKLLLFLTAALLIGRLGSARAGSLVGAGRAMPLAVGLFLLGSLSVLGLPPLGGFASKLWILSGFASAQVFWPIALILIGAMLEAAYYFRWIAIFYRADGSAAPDHPSAQPPGPPVPRLAYLPLLTLAGLLLTLGLAPFLLESTLVQAADALLDRQATIEAVLGANP
jgi:formate hydrogenlyase subunit 3/multisubunit Na+/H+ antiporter MnhD subunit